MTAATALQKALYQALSTDAALLALIGPGRVHDDVPDGLKPPYVVFSDMLAAPLGSSTEDGEEHTLSIDAWSSQNGRSEVTRIAGAIRISVAQIGGIEAPCKLVAIHFTASTIAREPSSRLYRATLNFRAVTENA
jgi:Protein of unknown function (DUF3168)